MKPCKYFLNTNPLVGQLPTQRITELSITISSEDIFKPSRDLRYDFPKQPSDVFCKKGGLINFVNFTGKSLCWSLFLRQKH